MSELHAAVWVDPGRRGGEVCVFGHRIGVDMVARNVLAWDGGVDFTRDTWELTRGEVLGACWFVAVHGSKKWRRRWSGWASENATAIAHGQWDQVADPPRLVAVSGGSGQDETRGNG